MSLINKMLQDLDRRSAMAAPDGKLPPQQVRAVPREPRGHEWFWRIIAGLIVVSLCWVAWIAYELRPPRPIATELAYQAAEEAEQKSKMQTAAAKPAAREKSAASKPQPEKPAVKEPAAPKPVAEKPMAPTPAVEKPAAVPPAATERAIVPVDMLKLALSIDTPIQERAPKPAPAPEAPVAKSEPKGKPLVTGAALAIKPGAAQAQGGTQLEKRDRTASAADRAETEFRRAVALLNQGRVSEGEGALTAALSASPAHEPARQAMVALLLEQHRVDDASRQLREALAINPAQVQFTVVLARIQAERRDYAAALDTLARIKEPAKDNPDYFFLQGAVLQRLSRHREAAESFQTAVHLAPEHGSSWMALGLSLENLARREEAADAYRRALAGGTLPADIRAYAEQRVRQLR